MTASSSTSADSAEPADSFAAPAPRPSALARARVIWVHRRILRVLIVRDLKVRYSNSVLGFAWTLLDPLILAIVYWFVFGVIIARGAPDEQPYILWLLTGLLPFQWTAHVLGDSGRLLGNDAKLVTSANLPREIWVLRSVSSRFVEFLFTLPITVVAVVLFLVLTDEDVVPSAWLLIIPLVFVVQYVFNVGLMLTLSPLCTLYPDVHRVVRVFSRLYRYMSPVIYGVAFLETVLSDPDKTWPSWMLVGNQTWPEWLLVLYSLNPLVGILNAYHAVLFPDNADHVWALLALSAVLSVLGFVFGWRIFMRLEPRVLKEL
jgi:ABC-2 type transport system permease protein